MANLHHLVTHIDAVSDVEDEGQLQRLQELTDEFFSSVGAAEHLDVWFRLFERFPEADGYEMFWSILHGLETQPGSGALAVASVQRRPSRFPVLMLNRLLNAGITHVNGVDLLALLDAAAQDDEAPESVRDEAREFAAYQRAQREEKA